MTFFSRCEPPQAVGRLARAPTRRRMRGSDPSPYRVLSDFFEEIEILFRYAAGLDYYDRSRLLPKD